uniref:megakaryocyte and platelet inhibitory receptor G6b isoform X5 n=1 Tax=Jaculus jaculus TaxID=51337 RepID=UPI00064D657D|nr:megakaryocyte and platelet inhibitory receptor G6b isoform X5 [Jaculus jaculus]
MALVLQLLSLLLSRTRGDPGASLDGRPGDRLNLSCIGVAYPIRWAWAPSFPACQGLPKGRRPILWASSSGTPAVPPLQRFSGRLRSLEPGIQRLELLLSAGDSGTFFCKGRHESESRTVLRVLGDREACRVPASTHGSGYPQVLFSLMGVGLMLGLGVLGVVYWRRRCLSPTLHIAPAVTAEPQRPLEEEPKILGDPDLEPSLLYADLDHAALGRRRRPSAVAPADAPTIYAVVV